MLMPVERIDSAILEIRGERVMIDHDLAAVYGVSTKALNQAVKRNRDRFPEGFAFQLTEAEKDELVTNCDRLATLKHSSSLPYAFTEHGAVMPASVLRSKRAIEVSVFVVKAFIRMRRMLTDQRQLAIRLSEFERKLSTHDRNFQVVFDVLRKLMEPTAPEPKKRRIGFGPDDNRTGSSSDFMARDKTARRHRSRKAASPDER